MINGGYYIKARKIMNSSIMRQPPHVREIWEYLLMNANHKDGKFNGLEIRRGSLLRSYKQIIEDLHWYIGWRKMTYQESHAKRAMKHLRDEQMIVTKKIPMGVLITVCNYETYQNPESYERTNEETSVETTKKLDLTQSGEGKNKNERKSKKKEKNKWESLPAILNTDEFKQLWEDYEQSRVELKHKPLGPTGMKLKWKQMSKWGLVVSLEALEESISQGWQGVFPIDSKNHSSQKQKLTPEEQNKVDWASFQTNEDKDRISGRTSS